LGRVPDSKLLYGHSQPIASWVGAKKSVNGSLVTVFSVVANLFNAGTKPKSAKEMA
jgi:hypothetical protein